MNETAAQQQNQQALGDWRDQLNALSTRCAEKRKELAAIEADLTAAIALVVDATGEKREELIFHWHDLRDARALCAAELDELSSRSAELSKRGPERVTVFEPFSPWRA